MNWYCLFLKSRSEFNAERGLIEQGFEVYLPKTVEHKLHNKPKTKPLFPEYMFIKLEIGKHDFNKVKFTKGVRCFTPQPTPLVVPDYVIVMLKTMEIKGIHELAENKYKQGDEIIATNGPFSMYKAIISKIKGDRIWVIFDNMTKRNAIEMNALDIESTN